MIAGCLADGAKGGKLASILRLTRANLPTARVGQGILVGFDDGGSI